MSAAEFSDTIPGPESANDKDLQRTENENRRGLESESDENEKSTKDSKGKETEDNKSKLNLTKQSRKENGDYMQETDKSEQHGSTKKKSDNLETLQKELSDKDKELSKTKTELQSTKEALNESNNKHRAGIEDLQVANTELKQVKKQLHDKDEELSKTKEDLNGTRNNLSAKAKDLQETEKKLEECIEQCLECGRVMAECCSKWDMEGKKREQAEEEAEKLRSANEKANGDLRALLRKKVLLLWRLAFRLVYEQQLKTKLRDMICARTEGLRTQLNTMFRKHMEEQNRLQALIERQNQEQEAAKEEWQTQEATLRDSIEELDVKKSELEDQVTHCQLQVKEREGSVEIAKVWVQKLSQQCGANDMIQEELDKTKTALARKDTLYQDTLEQLQGAQRDAVQLQVNLDREKQLTAAMGNAALQRATDVRHDHQRIVVIKEENEKLERALRDAHRCNEEQCEELMKNKLERKKLVAELLSLRRQLTNMTENKDRLQVKCNHLEYELSQSPLNSTPNNTNTRHDQDPDTSLDPALYGLDQLSPVHHSPDVWSRQDAGSWSNMDESFNN
ncbi:uncharacterized protein [Haliotis asinina]|uniref:uncharacterized protein n=1 Tax=Haliotis asinina TaxID=109174 RepID=UPI003531D249